MTESTRRLILITGIPGTGKTCTGDYLQKHYGFQHVNLEDIKSVQTRKFWVNPSGFTQAATGDLVATWGFPPRLLGIVDEFRNLGFFVLWFDGARDAALRHFNRRATVPERQFHVQMGKVKNSGVVSALDAPQINPFEEDGEFRPSECIAKEILDLEERRRRNST